MTAEEKQRLELTIGPVAVYERLSGVPGSGWLLIEASPLPHVTEKHMVAADIFKNGPVRIEAGQLRHSGQCTFKGHNLPKEVSKAVSTIIETKYIIAVYKGSSGVLEGQPVAIPLRPTISYIQYPDHPHLNTGRLVSIEGESFYLPDSLCYTNSPKELGETDYGRIFEALIQVLMWLFRHEIWLATRSIKKPGLWIGPDVENDTPEICAGFLNPEGVCRCMSDKKYFDCHMPRDIQKLKKSVPEVVMLNDKNYAQLRWLTRIYGPQLGSIRKLSEAFNVSQV